ncbi:SLC5 family protein [Exilibacterium tricleocarpae]|uniref:SLC5 family protein n=1 Tax=Exilibacterium tricleocarpae TaxID=2591008 RepID=A0A545SY64_9GAMM|nr:SLC5 family protein [Exilibacterium tricleocarpae]TQV69901.1 SLC5 family protein [Exilibacterium tricleocarpae]
MDLQAVQVGVFAFITALIGFVTYWKCRGARHSSDSNKEYFLAGGGLSWIFVAGSITLTNLSTDQLVGMNGNQMALLAWWEFAAVVGLIILAKVFLPVYYKYNCTTTTELLEKRYKDKHIRATISVLFLLGNVFIYLPIMLYTGSLFMQSMFGIDTPIIILSAVFAIVGAAYAVLGGLRAVAISDTFSGVLLLGMGIVVVLLALAAIDYDFSGIPAERLTMIGDNESPIPWHTLLTGMIFIQAFYWSTNQNITQRAMAAPTLREAQKGVFAAAAIRLLIVPAIIVLPGIVSYKLYGDIGDAAYGRVVGDLMPTWMSGAFAAAVAAAVLTSFNSFLNSSAALYVCDIHEKYISPNPNVPKLSGYITGLFVLVALLLVPVYDGADSIINLVQQLNGLLSMPILSTFVVGLVFRNVDARAAIIAVISGVGLYAFFSFVWMPLHYIHMMFFTLGFCILTALGVNRAVYGKRAELVWKSDNADAVQLDAKGG